MGTRSKLSGLSIDFSALEKRLASSKGLVDWASGVGSFSVTYLYGHVDGPEKLLGVPQEITITIGDIKAAYRRHIGPLPGTLRTARGRKKRAKLLEKRAGKYVVRYEGLGYFASVEVTEPSLGPPLETLCIRWLERPRVLGQSSLYS